VASSPVQERGAVEPRAKRELPGPRRRRGGKERGCSVSGSDINVCHFPRKRRGKRLHVNLSCRQKKETTQKKEPRSEGLHMEERGCTKRGAAWQTYQSWLFRCGCWSGVVGWEVLWRLFLGFGWVRCFVVLGGGWGRCWWFVGVLWLGWL